MKEKDIYAKIRDVRQSKGLTVHDLAKEIGENHQKIGRIERGKRSLTIDYLLRISKALNTPVETFLHDEKKRIEQTEAQKDTTELLNEIVVLIEKKNTQLSQPFNAEDKGRLITKTYKLALQFPTIHQKLFIESFLEGIFSFQPVTAT